MNKFVDSIPLDFQPRPEEHVAHENAVRALLDNEISVESFTPEYLLKGKSFFSGDPSSYSLSLFSSAEKLRKRFNCFSRFWKKHKGIAVGPTKIERGISLKAEESGHIDYYLYDAYNNNPCADFRLLSEDGES